MSSVPNNVEEINPWARYTNLERIGQGAHGTVHKVKELSSSQIYALKLLPRGSAVDQNVKRELLNHRRLRPHPNVTGFKEVFLTPDHLGIVLEYASAGELFRRVHDAKRLHENLARFYFQQIITGLDHLHSSGVCHRDIKLENTLVHEENGVPVLKICDFGYSKHVALDSMPHSRVGTPSYVAPEVVVQRSGYDGHMADMWSAGVMLYVMLVGRYPFEDPNDPSNMRLTLSRIMQGRYHVPNDIQLSEQCRQLLGSLLKVEPSQRMTVREVRQHPWFQDSLPDEIRYNYPQGCGISYPAASTQSIEDINHILEAAQQGGRGQARGQRA